MTGTHGGTTFWSFIYLKNTSPNTHKHCARDAPARPRARPAHFARTTQTEPHSHRHLMMITSVLAAHVIGTSPLTRVVLSPRAHALLVARTLTVRVRCCKNSARAMCTRAACGRRLQPCSTLGLSECCASSCGPRSAYRLHATIPCEGWGWRSASARPSCHNLRRRLLPAS